MAKNWMERGKKMARKFKVVVNGREYIVEVEEIKEEKRKTVEKKEEVKQEVKREERKPEKNAPEPVSNVVKEEREEVSGKVHEVKAPMAGIVLKILVKVGQRVEVGDPLVVFEAMKMENELQSEYSGTVKEILIKEGDNIETGRVLMRIG